MIASNYIKHPEALRFQCEMFSNGYHNSPRIMRLMECMCRIVQDAPQWVKDAAAKAKALVKRWKAAQLECNFTNPIKVIKPVSLTFKELDTPTRQRAKAAAAIAKKVRAAGRTSFYFGPYGETWSGRGLMPRWLVARRDSFHEPISKWLIEC